MGCGRAQFLGVFKSWKLDHVTTLSSTPHVGATRSSGDPTSTWQSTEHYIEINCQSELYRLPDRACMGCMLYTTDSLACVFVVLLYSTCHYLWYHLFPTDNHGTISEQYFVHLHS